jgi:hypothetical protein
VFLFADYGIAGYNKVILADGESSSIFAFLPAISIGE